MDLCEFVNSRCGEIYLSAQGTLVFLCSLCNNALKGYGVYLQHIIDEHDLPVHCVEENVNIEDEFSDFDSEVEVVPIESIEIVDDPEVSDAQYSTYYPSGTDTDVKYDIVSNDTKSPEVQVKAEQDSTEKLNEFMEIKEEEDINSGDIKSVLSSRQGRKKKPYTEHSSQSTFDCPICEMSIKGKSNLEKHILRHDDENKRYECAYCPKKFHVKFELNQHEASHTGERPFLCTICGRRFISTGKLNEHVNMTHENIRNKRCEICNKMFYSNKYLWRHMTAHTDERLYACEICGSKFKVKKTLRNHMKIHENKKEYKCNLCNSKFNQRPALHSHMKSRHRSLIKNSQTKENVDFV